MSIFASHISFSDISQKIMKIFQYPFHWAGSNLAPVNVAVSMVVVS